MKKLLLTTLLPLALAAHAAPDASLAKQSALLQELQKNHSETYNSLSGTTLAEAYRAYNPQLLARLRNSSDTTFAQYADSFVKALTQLGKQNPKACHTFLTGKQTPSLPELQLLLGSKQHPLDPALKALLADQGGWQAPADLNPATLQSQMENIIEAIRADGKGEGLDYTLGGQTPENDAQTKAACEAGTEFFKRLNQPQDKNKILALRFILTA